MSSEEKQNSLSPKQRSEDASLDLALRPKNFNEYVGQDKLKKNLKILIEAAKKRNEPIEHVLFHGPAGLGKTTLAHLVAREMNAQIKITSGPAISKVGDLVAIILRLEDGDILFIDEIHRLSKMVEEILYPALESRSIDFVSGKGPSAQSYHLPIKPFTLIAATTRTSLLSSPLRSRFSGGTFRLDFYDLPDIEKILTRNAKILCVEALPEAIKIISSRARSTPRIANRLLKRARDYAEVKGEGIITPVLAEAALKLLEIDEAGLESLDRKILESIIKKFNGGPVGLGTIAASIIEEEDTIAEIYEPYLIQLGFLDRTPRGRCATIRAYEHMGIKIPAPQAHDQQKLI